MLMNTAVYVLWSLFVLLLSGCKMAMLTPLTTVILLLGFAGLAFFLIKTSEDAAEEKILTVITIVAIALRTFYVLYTGAEQRQHDVGEFDTYLENNYHAEYIEYLLENHRLFPEDVSVHWQFYHPPLHHFICAVFFGIYRTIMPSMAHNWDALQALSLLWSLITLETLRRFNGVYGLSGKSRIISYAVVAIHPQLIVFSGALNNDPLALMFSVLALFLAWKWYLKRNSIIFFATSICIGLGMMAKLSAGLVAVPIAFLMIRVLISSKDKIRYILKCVAFVAVCAPLGLWYQIRNLILWKMPITYVAVPDTVYNPGLLVGDVPFWKRFLDFGSNDYNIIYETMEQAVFDGDYYRDNMFLAMTGYFLLASFMLVCFMALLGLIISWVRKGNTTFNAYLTILAATEIISYVVFCFRYPFTCTMSFRYIVPLLIVMSYHLGIANDRGPHLVKLFTNVACYVFAGLSFLFYLMVWIK